jgi:hypothetical protein
MKNCAPVVTNPKPKNRLTQRAATVLPVKGQGSCCFIQLEKSKNYI